MKPKRDPEWFYDTFARIVRPFLCLLTRRKWGGAKHLPPAGGFIAVSNHTSSYDPLTFAHYLYGNGYRVRFLAKSTLFKVPVVGWILRRSKQIPVYRGTAHAADSLQDAAAALSRGECVGLFPEGTLTLDPDCWPMEAKTGAARLALTTGMPVIPIGQWGAAAFCPPSARYLRVFPRKTCHVVAGPEVDLSEFAGKHVDADTLRAATARIMDALTVLVADLRGEPVPARRFDMRTMAYNYAEPTQVEQSALPCAADSDGAGNEHRPNSEHG